MNSRFDNTTMDIPGTVRETRSCRTAREWMSLDVCHKAVPPHHEAALSRIPINIE